MKVAMNHALMGHPRDETAEQWTLQVGWGQLKGQEAAGGSQDQAVGWAVVLGIQVQMWLIRVDVALDFMTNSGPKLKLEPETRYINYQSEK